MSRNENKSRMAKKLKISIWVSVAVMMVLSFIGGYFAHYLIKGKDANTASWIVNVIENNYCVYDEETGKIKEFKPEDYADALVNLLDRYSTYYTPEEYSDVISTSKGNNYGIGVAFLSSSTDCTVFKVTGNSPADKAGIKKGDVIVRVVQGEKDQSFTNHTALREFLAQAEENKDMTVHILRDGNPVEITLKKGVFITSYVEYFDSEINGKFMSEGTNPLVFTEMTNTEIPTLPQDTAYISLAQFEGGAGEQIKEALAVMKKRGRTKLIFDLRDNGGGYMSILSNIASNFIYADSGSATVAIVKDKNEKISYYNSTGNNFNNNINKIAVLANENTASASECLIGAMLYYGRAFSVDSLIIEKNSEGVARTYGKGIMQTTFMNIYTGEALKLTTAYVFQPDGVTTIHGKGIRTTETNGVEKGLALDKAVSLLQN